MDELQIMENYVNSVSNHEVEKVVLGSLLLESNTYYSYSDQLFADLFTTLSHKYVFQAIKEVIDSGSKVDLVTVAHQMHNAGYFSLLQKEGATGGPAMLGELTQRISSTAHFQHHLDILVGLYMLRKLQMMSLNVNQKCTAMDDPKEIIDFINSNIVELVNINDEEFDKENTIQKTLKSMELSSLDNVIKSGIKGLDDFIFGFELCDLIIIGGAPSMGKTAFMLRLVMNMIHFGMYPAIFSLEMNDTQLTSRLLSMKSMISLSDIRRRNLAPNQWTAMHEAAAWLNSQNFIIDDKTSSLNQITNKIRKYNIKYGTKVFFIDYLQLVKVNLGRKTTREQEVATISRTFKELCRDLNIIIFALCQLNRDVGKRTDTRPKLSDLRESGAIEQDADMVLFPYRPAYYDTFETSIPYKEDAKIIVAKGRGTGINTDGIPINFISSRTLYLNNNDADNDTPSQTYTFEDEDEKEVEPKTTIQTEVEFNDEEDEETPF